MNGDYEDLRAELDQISERLDDHISTTLREALEHGATARPADERILSRARAAVDKASALLGRLTED